MTHNDTLLQINGLCIEARGEDGWSRIVHGVDLTLRRGEILGLIGESGAGKSTIGLAAMGYSRDGCRIAEGSIIFDGIDLMRASEKQRQALRGTRIAYVAQSAAANFNPAHRLIDQCCETAVLHGLMSRDDAAREAVRLYEKLRLPNSQDIGFRYPHQLSGGQLQRAMTAMAMLCKPDLIIFDEPTTALDVTTQVEVIATIRDVVRQFGVAAIYITHDLAVVAQMADTIKVLRHGREVEQADTRTMLNDPREAYTRSLWAVRSLRNTPKAPVLPGQTPIIRIDHVTASYGGLSVPVLKDVTFDIHPGRTVAVVGESGSGKSTTARCIAGLLAPFQGVVSYNGQALPNRVSKRSKQQLREIQMIYQMADTALNPKKRISDIIGRPVEFYLGLKGEQKKTRVRELLTLIELDPDIYYDRLPTELSGGQKQRIGIARALAANPRFIICDEITSALDQLVAEGILKLLDRLQQELNLTYLFITHDLATVNAIADDVIVMRHGRVVDAGLKEKVFAPPYNPYTELLLSSVPQMDPDWLTRMLDARSPLSSDLHKGGDAKKKSYEFT